MFKTFVLLTFAIFRVAFIQAQNNVTLTGMVIDKEATTPMQFVNVVVLSIPDSTIIGGGLTDERGVFKINNIDQGNYWLRSKFIGYDENFTEITVTGQSKNQELGVIELEESTLKKDEVVIEAERKLMETSIDKRVFNVDQDLSARGGSAEDVLQNVPSVEVDQDGNISLRGNSNVIILIDGRPSTLSGGSRGAVLNGIPAESIERIEIVTNPSAKYDPDGMTGIINIVLKKNKLRGINGNVSLSLGSGNSNTASFGVNYRTSKINLFLNYSTRINDGYRNFYGYRTRELSDTETETFLQERLGRDNRTDHTLKTGVDYTIKPGHVTGISLTLGNNRRDRTGLLSNDMQINGADRLFWYRNSIENSTDQSFEINTNYQWQFKEKRGELMFNLTNSRSQGDNFSFYDEYGFEGSPYGLYYNERFDNPEASNITTASLDIVRKFKAENQIEYGLKAIINIGDETQYREIYDFPTSTYFPDLSINNSFRLTEQIYSAYGIYAQKFKKFGYQLGLRLEQALVNPELITTNQVFENNYFSFFPSAHFVFPMAQGQELFLSYSRRINRPGSGSLNPFVEFTDPFTLRYGNPALRPEYTNSFETGFNRESKKITLNNTFYYRHSYDVLQRVIVFDDLGRSAVTWDNIAQSINWGYEGIATYKPTAWWRNVFSVNVYQIFIRTDNPLLQNNAGINWNAKLTSSFEFWEKTGSVQINGQYSSIRITPQGFVQRGPNIDVSFQKSFLNKSLDLTFRVSDIFDWMQFYIQTDVPGVYQERTYKWQTRRVFITLNYNFGRMQAGRESRDKSGPRGGGGGDDMM